MCQIVPFTLPCCKRVYVSVSKLPSCPDEWPKSKCPAELCIQVRAQEPERRAVGICWRCKAVSASITHAQRVYLKPAIDSAIIVHGLEEFDVPERRNKVQEVGNCEPKLLQQGTAGSKNLPRKRVRNGLGPDKTRSVNKRVRIDLFDSKDTASSSYSHVYPDLGHDKTSQYPYLGSHGTPTAGSSINPCAESSSTNSTTTNPTHLQQNLTLPPLPQGSPPIPAGWNWEMLTDHTGNQTGVVYPQQYDHLDAILKDETHNKQNLPEPLQILDPALESIQVERQQLAQFEDFTTLDDDALETLWKEYNAQQQGHQAESQSQQHESKDLPRPQIL